MQPQLSSADDAFASALAHFSTTCDWLRDDAMGLAHGEIDTRVPLVSREIARGHHSVRSPKIHSNNLMLQDYRESTRIGDGCHYSSEIVLDCRKHPVRTIFRDRAGVPSFAA